MSEIIPRDYRVPPTPQDTRMASALKHWAHQNAKEKLTKQDFYKALGDMYEITSKKGVVELVDRLWRCGLLSKSGDVDARSGRLKNQRWTIE